MKRQRATAAAVLAASLAGVLLVLGGPVGAAPEPTTLYVTDIVGGSLVPVDATDGTVGPPIAVGEIAHDVAISDDGETAYVTSVLGSAVVPVDLDTSTAGTPIPVECPVRIALVPGQSKAYVTQHCTSTVTPLDLSTNTAGTPIEVGPGLFDVTVAPDGSTAYVTTWGDDITPGALTPMDVASDSVGAPILLGALRYPASVVVTPDGSTGFVAVQEDSSVFPVDLATSAVGTPIAVPPNPMGLALTPDGTRLYVTHYPLVPDGLGEPEVAQDVTPIDVATLTALPPIAVGLQTFGIAVTDDGTTAFVALSGDASVPDDGAVVPIDVATETAGAAIALPGDPAAVAIRPTAADTTPPTLAPTVSGSGPGGAVLLNDPAPITEPNADDGTGSGVASASCDAPNVSGVGERSLSCSATDNAGNTHTVEVSYLVEYLLVGLSPADGASARAGRPVQIRVSLADATQALVAPCAGCSVTFEAFAVGGSGQDAGPFELRYHAASQQLRTSWKPSASGTGPTRITVTVHYPGTTLTTTLSAEITLT